MPSIGHWLYIWPLRCSGYLALKTTNQRVLLVKTWSVLVADEFLVPDRTCHWTSWEEVLLDVGDKGMRLLFVTCITFLMLATACSQSSSMGVGNFMPRKHWGACGATRAVMVQWNPQLLVTPALHVVILWDNLSCMTQAMQLKAQSHKQCNQTVLQHVEGGAQIAPVTMRKK